MDLNNMRWGMIRIALLSCLLALLSSCGCTRYSLTFGTLRSSGYLYKFSISEVNVGIGELIEYGHRRIPAKYKTDTHYVIEVADNGKKRQRYKIIKSYESYICTKYVNGVGVVTDNMSAYILPNRKYIIIGLSRMHCPSISIYFETNKNSRIKNVVKWL